MSLENFIEKGLKAQKAVDRIIENEKKIAALLEAAKEMYAVIYHQSLKRKPEEWGKAIAQAERKS